MPCDAEISRIRTGGSSGFPRARARTARHAYSAFAEIFMNNLLEPASHGDRGRGGRGDRSELAAVERVQAALGLRLARPAAGPLVLAGGHRAGAGPAADRGIALVVERVVR